MLEFASTLKSMFFNRLVSYVQIVDLATLTGACVVALGPSIAGLFVCFF